MDLSDLYSTEIIKIAGRLAPENRLKSPDASARRASRICGSVAEVDIKMRDGKVAEYGQEVNACALGQTAASIMAEHIVGSTPEELRVLRHQVEAMLKKNGPPPTGKWVDIKYLEPVRDFPPRHASVMLVFNAVVEALDKISESAAH